MNPSQLSSSLVATIASAAMSILSACGGKTGIPAPPIEDRVLSIQHREFGLEKFQVGDARCNTYQAEDGSWEFVVKVRSSIALERSRPLSEVTKAQPHFEATTVSRESKFVLTPGQLITQPQGYDRKRHRHLTNFFYFTHETIDELRIEVLGVSDEWIEANVTGIAVINGSNLSRPDAKFSVRSRFKKDGTLRRGFD